MHLVFRNNQGWRVRTSGEIIPDKFLVIHEGGIIAFYDSNPNQGDGINFTNTNEKPTHIYYGLERFDPVPAP